MGTPTTVANFTPQAPGTRTVVALTSPSAGAPQPVLPKVVSVQSVAATHAPAVTFNGHHQVMPKVVSVHSALAQPGPVLAPKQVAQVRAVPVSGQLVVNTRPTTTTGEPRGPGTSLFQAPTITFAAEEQLFSLSAHLSCLCLSLYRLFSLGAHLSCMRLCLRRSFSLDAHLSCLRFGLVFGFLTCAHHLSFTY